ncbi:hypothetical protein [Mucilaginibacter aquariorum]|uniref:Uncharacterized protein n=1 Tax=Mucilaginibacter aquariorum TaxID=2967225 RepID=A0ABT1SZ38_9SPHI|nr:hypothetical protein [Mucilaginibacter aquariorum]MCQ6957336.1 hypothetical protein [Mucilaginibacter aquariorum]
MKQLNALARFMIQAAKNTGILPTHISLYLALFWSWKQNNFCEPFAVYRKELMVLAHINSIATYHKCIKDLSDMGIIGYVPSYNYYRGSLIYLADINQKPLK